MSTVTRWWFVRHAPVVGVDGKIYGSDDVDCDISDRAAFAALAGTLPGDGVWLTSHLSRAKRTAKAITAAGLETPQPIVEEHLGEQCFGQWQGSSWDEMQEKDPDAYAAFWEKPAHNAPPGGESFADLINRTGRLMDRYTADHAGRDIVAVCHGSTIRAAMAHVLDLSPEMGMSFSIGTLSVTRLEHVAGGLLRGHGGAWRVVAVNRPSGRTDDGVIR